MTTDTGSEQRGCPPSEEQRIRADEREKCVQIVRDYKSLGTNLYSGIEFNNGQIKAAEQIIELLSQQESQPLPDVEKFPFKPLYGPFITMDFVAAQDTKQEDKP